MSRGLAKRTLPEDRESLRYFKSRIPQATRRGAEFSSWILETRRRHEIELWRVLEGGLQRDFSGLRRLEIARRIDASSEAFKRSDGSIAVR
jgi:hypothetical protein